MDPVRDLLAHMAWADARVWRAILAHPDASTDEAVLDTAFHLHQAQWVFLDVCQGRRFEVVERTAFPSPEAIRDRTRAYHGRLSAFLAGLEPGDLEREVRLPWSKHFVPEGGGAAAPTTLTETLLQVAGHSAYHRGQVNRRIRQVGGEPPLVDYIAWIWGGRPAPRWDPAG